MVNVTKSNFLEQSNDLLKHLPTAAFVAIDEEMTGICLPGSKRPSKDDTPSQRYASLKPVPERYAIIQFGVALFHEHPDYASDKTGDEFLVRRYNFYLFPPSSNDVTREVTLNPSSVAFLNEHNMNFDLWTKEGIPFVTGDVAKTHITKYVEKLAAKQAQQQSKNNNNGTTTLLLRDPQKRNVELHRAEDINFHARAMASLREWIDAASNSRRSRAAARAAAAAAATNHDENNNNNEQQEGMSFLLPPCNAFLRRALYETIEGEYPSLVLERGGPTAPNQIRVWRLNPEEKERREERLRKEEWEDLVVNQLGFWRVFHAISNACRGYYLADDVSEDQEHSKIALAQSYNDMLTKTEESAALKSYDTGGRRRIPIVVHNGLMDLLFLLTHFHSHELPSSYEETKALIHSYFPEVYDTKILSSECSDSNIRNDNTVLSNLYKKLVQEDEDPKRIQFANQMDNSDEDDDDNNNGDQVHEAAYDAYMTGAVYVTLCRRILDRCGANLSWKGPHQVGSLIHLLAPEGDENARRLFGRNKIYLMLTLYTIDLESPSFDPLSRGMSPSSTFRVSGIDPSVTTRDIVRCLSNREQRVNFEIVWVDDTTFMVATRYTPNEITTTDDDDDDNDSVNNDDDNDEEQEESLSTLERHGQLIYTSLRNRFSKEEKIITLEEHLKQVEKQREAAATRPSWKWPSRLAAVLGLWQSINGAKKKRANESSVEPSAKRRRVDGRASYAAV